MSSEDSYGPGVGTLIGLKFAENANHAEFVRERERLRREIHNAGTNALGALATKDAAKAVLNKMVDELAREASGAKDARRLSDPRSAPLRASAFVDTAEGQLARSSERRLGFPQPTQDRIKLQGQRGIELADILAMPGMGMKAAPRKP
jgi:hypothetical protein